MLVIGWLITWLAVGDPTPRPWNGWLISLLICLVLELFARRDSLRARL